MKNTLKTIIALVLVGVMMFTSMSALADNSTSADMTNEAGRIGEFTTPDVPTIQKNSVVIYKEITAYNPAGSTVNAPAITFNYTIGAGDAGKHIYDANSHHNKVNGENVNAHALTKAGVGTPTITGTATGALTLSPTEKTHQLKTSANGTANRFPLTVDFGTIFKDGDSIKYTAGVYRYVITETTTEATKNASGIKEGNGPNTLYMDVYVDGSGNIYGYVLFTNNEDDINASENDDAGAATAAGKTEGFVGTQPDDGAYAAEADSTADKYYTFDLIVGKKVENDEYSITNKNKFPFEITLANTTVTANVLPVMTINDATLADQTELSAVAIAGTWKPNIAHGGRITYVGIPTGTTVKIKEQNNVLGVTYVSSSAGADSGKDAVAKDIYTNDWSNEATVDCNATALTIAEENHTTDGVIFTNTLLQISPTGVTLRFAPYILILAAGIVLLLVSRRRKSNIEK